MVLTLPSSLVPLLFIMKKGTLKKLLGSGSFTVVNKHLTKKIGLTETYLFQYLLDLQDNVFHGEEFYQQQSRISEETGLSEKVIRSTVSELVRLRLLSTNRKGIPAKIYYHIDDEITTCVVMDLLDDTKGNNKNIPNVTTSSDDISQQDVTKGNILSEQKVTSNTISKDTILSNTKSEDINTKNTISENTNTDSIELLKQLFPKQDIKYFLPSKLSRFDYSEDWDDLLSNCIKHLHPDLTNVLKNPELRSDEYTFSKFQNKVNQYKSEIKVINQNKN